jgi:hypothetical protein
MKGSFTQTKKTHENTNQDYLRQRRIDDSISLLKNGSHAVRDADAEAPGRERSERGPD